MHEKGGKRPDVPCHHSLMEYLDAWIAAAGVDSDKKGGCRSIRKGDRLTNHRMDTNDVPRMIERRATGPACLFHLLSHLSRDR
jgi:integrase/recombinase XerD